MAMFGYFEKWAYCINVLSIIQLCTLTIILCTINGSYKSGYSIVSVLGFVKSLKLIRIASYKLIKVNSYCMN